MSRERFLSIDSFPKRFGPDGKALCRYCGGPLGKGRRSWCGDKCVEEFMVRSSAGFARSKLLERDHGVCAVCGTDTERLAQMLRWARYGLRMMRCEAYAWYGPTRHAWALKTLEHRWPWLKRVRGRVSLWDADHIHPVVLGGGQSGLDNLRTLCIGCHKAETKALAGRRAKDRKESCGTP